MSGGFLKTCKVLFAEYEDKMSLIEESEIEMNVKYSVESEEIWFVLKAALISEKTNVILKSKV